MESIFKDVREKAGLDINHVSKALKIRREYLLALESGDYRLMPAQVYVDGYKKIYANYLGISLETNLDQEKISKKTKKVSGSSLESKLSKIFVPGSFILFLIVIYCWQYIMNTRAEGLIDHLSTSYEEYDAESVVLPYAKEYNPNEIESKLWINTKKESLKH